MDQPVRPARSLDRGLCQSLRLTGLALAAALAVATPGLTQGLTGADLSATGPEAQTLVLQLTGLRLPQGVKVTHAIPGGFQDPFLQFRAEVPDAVLDSLLRGLGVDPATLEARTFPARGDGDPPWWDLSLPGTAFARAAIPEYPNGTVYVAPGPSGTTIVQVFLFQT